MENIQIKHFIYFDREYIDSLYHQISDIRTPSKVTIKNTFSGIADIGFIPNFTVDAKARREQESEHKIEITTEYKTDVIIKKLLNGEISLLPDIVSQEFQENSKLIACLGLFRFKYAYDENVGCYLTQNDIAADPLRKRNLIFTFESNSSITNVPNKIGYYYVELLFSGSKMTRGVRHITNNIRYGTEFVFGILGEITQCRIGFFSIKPGAIWRMTATNLS